MAIIDIYVDPDATGNGDGGGDGAANDPTDEDNWTDAYTSQNAAEAAEAAAFDGDNLVIYCRSKSGGDDTTAVNYNGSTFNDADDYMTIKAPSSAGDSGDQRADKAGWQAGRYLHTSTIDLSDDYIRLEDLQIATLNGFAVGASSEIRVSGCRFGGTATRALQSGDNELILKMWNCIVDGSYSDGFYFAGCNLAEIYNSIVYGCGGDGYEWDAETGIVKNCAAINNGDDFDIAGGATVTLDHNASDDGDGGNAVAPSGADWDNEYVDAANGDFTLVASGNCEGGGTDNPGSGLYSTDIDGDAYSSTWSIGVDAKAAAGATGAAGQSVIDVIAHTLVVAAAGNIGVSQAIVDVIPFTASVLGAANTSPSRAIIEVVPFTHSVVGHASVDLSQGITEVTPYTATAGAATVAAVTQAIVDVIPFTTGVLGDANISLSQAITEVAPFTAATQYDFVQAITQAVVEIIPFTVATTTPDATAAISQAAINIAPYTVGVSVGEWIETLTKEVVLILSRQANVRLDESTSKNVTITEGREVVVKL